MKKISPCWFIGVVLLFAACGGGIPEDFSTVVFDMGDGGSLYYRIPAIETAADGSIIALSDKRWENLNDLPARIDVVCRRSTDGGRTWGEPVTVAASDEGGGYGDPAIVLDRDSGDLISVFAHGPGFWQSTADNPLRICISRSSDNGLSWTEPCDITAQIYGAECEDNDRSKWQGAFAASGHALQLSCGRLMFVVAVRTTAGRGGISNYACYSDDGGATWSVSENAADTNGDEAKVAELPDGSILMSIRAKGHRHFSKSFDRGRTWSEASVSKDVIEPACNGDILSMTVSRARKHENVLLQTVPCDSTSRRNVSILYSPDQGCSWQLGKVLCEGASAYSSLTILPDGAIGALVEEGSWSDGFTLRFYHVKPDFL